MNKVDAVIEVISDYKDFNKYTIEWKEVASEISEQPISLEETIQWAKNRARNAYEDKLSFGIEDGLMKVPYTKTGFMNVCVCAIFDGITYHLWLSSAFESPKKVMDLILNKNLDMSEAYNLAWFTSDWNIWQSEWVIWILTKNRLKRLEYIKQAVLNAMIHLENDMW